MNFNDTKMGKLARDKVTGFEGIIIGKALYLFGCTQYCLSPKAKETGMQGAEWLDEGRVEIVGEGVSPASVQTAVPGGPNTSAPSRK